jgi:hypothetical protein
LRTAPKRRRATSRVRWSAPFAIAARRLGSACAAASRKAASSLRAISAASCAAARSSKIASAQSRSTARFQSFACACITRTPRATTREATPRFRSLKFERLFLKTEQAWDEWHFRVSIAGTGTKIEKVRYQRVVATHGDAPPQYPDPDESDDDAPTFGINLVTGEKIKFGW